MIDPKLVEMLRCPIDGSPLGLAAESLISRINQGIQRGEIRDRLEQRVDVPLEGGLINRDATRIYPIRDGIPSLVVDESIEIGKMTNVQ